jgi:hypothetical protein
MVTKKDLIIAVLATFCLTVAIFMIMPIKSANNPYDPLLDNNHDGKIGLSDLVQFASSYGTAGDPTINVNVTAMPYNLQSGTINMTITGSPASVVCGGYSRLSLLVLPTNASVGSNNAITVVLYAISWYSAPPIGQYYPLSTELVNPDVFNFTIFNGGSPWYVNSAFLTSIKAPYCDLMFHAIPVGASLPSTWWVTFDYAVYLRNE